MKTKKTEVIAGFLRQIFEGKEFPPCQRKIGRPSARWTIIGYPEIINAIRLANLPLEKFWRPSAIAPNAQSPTEIVKVVGDLWNGKVSPKFCGHSTTRGFLGSIYAKCPYCGALLDCGIKEHSRGVTWKQCQCCYTYFWYTVN